METEKELAYMSTNAEDNKGDDFIEARIHFLRHQVLQVLFSKLTLPCIEQTREGETKAR